MNREWLALLNNLSLLNDIFINNIIAQLRLSSSGTVDINEHVWVKTPILPPQNWSANGNSISIEE